jgi:cytochrome b
MTLEELLVLVVVALLAVVVFAEGRGGTLTVRVGLFLLTLVMLAALVALLHMLAR